MTHHPDFLPSDGDPIPQILRVWMQAFRSQFTIPSWEHVLVLIMGTVLAPGKRTISACLRMTGRAGTPRFSRYHQILNRARWNPEPPRVYRRVICLMIMRPYRVCSGLHEMRLLCFCGRDVSDRAKQAAVVIPGDLLAGRRCLHRGKAISAFPTQLHAWISMDQFG
jgi:hypothetical protein